MLQVFSWVTASMSWGVTVGRNTGRSKRMVVGCTKLKVFILYSTDVYATGGNGVVLQSVERLDTRTGLWTEVMIRRKTVSIWFLSQVEEMSTPRELAAATVFSGKIYIMGGRSGDEGNQLSSGEVCSQ